MMMYKIPLENGNASKETRAKEMGKRPVKVANCSGYSGKLDGKNNQTIISPKR
jgi:hypothetical protein